MLAQKDRQTDRRTGRWRDMRTWQGFMGVEPRTWIWGCGREDLVNSSGFEELSGRRRRYYYYLKGMSQDVGKKMWGGSPLLPSCWHTCYDICQFIFCLIHCFRLLDHVYWGFATTGKYVGEEGGGGGWWHFIINYTYVKHSVQASGIELSPFPSIPYPHYADRLAGVECPVEQIKSPFLGQ